MASTGNSLLDSLPPDEFALIEPALGRVDVPRGTVLLEYGAELDHLDFPIFSMVTSLTTQTSEGDPIEVTMIGGEGVVGAWVASGVTWSPWFAVAQVAGEVWRWPAADFERDLSRMPVLQARMRKYMLTQTFLMSQSVLCNRFHELSQRTARWLLILQAKSKADPLPVTQEFLSQMLGVHRPSVTLALQSLSEAGLIRSEGRGLIRITDAEALQGTACECVRQVVDFNRAATGHEDASFLTE